MDLRRRELVVSVCASAGLCLPAPAFARPLADADRPRPPRLLLAATYTDAIDPAACLVSEKFDGVRAFWDGRRLWHRSGRAIASPLWFTERLPRGQALDGELWLGRGHFETLVGTVRRARPDDAEWRRLRYLVFELPDAPGPFADRAEHIDHIVKRAGWPGLQAVPQGRVADRTALRNQLEAVVRAGGEGLMLHRADAPYLTGRSDVLTKLKPQLDAEARVIGTRPGQGRFAGSVGALQVETADGVRFHLGSGLPDSLRRHPPPRGTVVTYRYHDRTAAGVPRFASFLRVHTAL